MTKWAKLVRFLSVLHNCTICRRFGDIWRWKSVAGFDDIEFTSFENIRSYRIMQSRCYRILRPSFIVKYDQSRCILYSCQVLKENLLVWFTCHGTMLGLVSSNMTNLTTVYFPLNRLRYDSDIKKKMSAHIIHKLYTYHTFSMYNNWKSTIWIKHDYIMKYIQYITDHCIKKYMHHAFSVCNNWMKTVLCR